MENIEQHFNEMYADFLNEVLHSVGLFDLEVEYNNQPSSIDTICLESFGEDTTDMTKYIPYKVFNKACQDFFGKPYQLLDTMERWVKAQSACYGRDCHYWTEEVGDYDGYFLDNLSFLFMEWWLQPGFIMDMTKNQGKKLWHHLATHLVKNIAEYKIEYRNQQIDTLLD